MLHRSKLIVGGVLVVLTSAVVSYAVSAAVPQALLPAGSSRYAFAGANTGTPTSTTSTTFVDLSGLTTTVKIPSGKKGDVFVLFCSETRPNGDFANVRALIGGVDSMPGETTLREGTSSQPEESQCANFARTGVSAGTKTVTIQWRSVGGAEITAYARSMIVLVNIR